MRLADAKQDAYIVGAISDHIVPWTSSCKATGLLGGSVRYVLSSGGHIAGIVNPPSPCHSGVRPVARSRSGHASSPGGPCI